MNTTAEMKIEISNGVISNANAEVMSDGTCKIKLEMAMQKQNNNEIANAEWILIEASKLSLRDSFMRYRPKTEAEKEFKATLKKVIKKGVDDFYRPNMDPSFADKEKTKIHYIAGEQPAYGIHDEFYKEYVENSKWTLGTKNQYVAFVGVLIKMLVSKGWNIAEAWDVICNNSESEKLGKYRRFGDPPVRTGANEFYGFFDLISTTKMLAKDKDDAEHLGCWLACRHYYNSDYYNCNPLVRIENSDYHYMRCHNYGYWKDSVPWLVQKKEI